MDKNTTQKTRVLFFAWGDSIHARRRIRIFAEDSAFEVGVISNFRYDFENTKNFYLTATGLVWHLVTGMTFLRKVVRGILSRLLHFLMERHDRETTFENCYNWIADAQLTRDYIKAFKPDIIFLQTLLYPCYLSFVGPRRIPLMITFWNGDITWWAKWNGMERLLKKKLVAYGVRRAAAITVNSQTAFAACLDYTTPEKIHLIRYPGVDMELFKPGSQEQARQRLGLPSGKLILCPRGLGGYLNSDVIIDAAASVIAKVPDSMFLFISGVGDDAEWQKHLNRAIELGISDHLRCDGQILWEIMPLYYQSADVVVSISSNDSLPNCMLEAMACGVPLVMGNIPQVREWVTNEVNCLLVPTRNPEELSKALLMLLEGIDTLTKEFVRYNLDLVGREFDSRKNSLLVKQLVHLVATKKAARISV